MANFTRVKTAGWALNEILTSAQMNALDINMTKAVNGDDGSSHVGDVTFGALTVTNDAAITGKLTERVSHWRTDFYETITFPLNEWNDGGDGAAVSAKSQPPAVEITSGAVSTDTHNIRSMYAHFVDTPSGYTMEAIVRITSAITTMIFEMAVVDDGKILEDALAIGVGVVYDTTQSDTVWTLAGADASGTTRSAGTTTVVQNTWYRLRVEVATDGSAELFVNGTSEATLAAGVVGGEVSVTGNLLYIRVETRTAADRVCEVERVEVWQPASA